MVKGSLSVEGKKIQSYKLCTMVLHKYYGSNLYYLEGWVSISEEYFFLNCVKG